LPAIGFSPSGQKPKVQPIDEPQPKRYDTPRRIAGKQRRTEKKLKNII